MQSLGSSRVTVITRPLACFTLRPEAAKIVATQLGQSGGGVFSELNSETDIIKRLTKFIP